MVYFSAVNPCANVRCANGGTCQNMGTDYDCICPLAYTGKDCELGKNYILYLKGVLTSGIRVHLT